MPMGNLISIGDHRNQLLRQFQPIDYNVLESFSICPDTYGCWIYILTASSWHWQGGINEWCPWRPLWMLAHEAPNQFVSFAVAVAVGVSVGVSEFTRKLFPNPKLSFLFHSVAFLASFCPKNGSGRTIWFWPRDYSNKIKFTQAYA